MYLKLIFLNALRHRLRTLLTLTGLVVAVIAFGLLQTVVDAWYAGAEGASTARLVTRNAVSLIFPLPLTYKQKMRQVDGVRSIAAANWFGGIYKEPKNFFPQFAVDDNYLDMYPEYVLDDAEKTAWLKDKKGAIVGRKLAEDYGLKPGDTLTLKGTIFPGNWDFVIRAIYDGREKKTDTSQLFFHWDYLNETLKQTVARRANAVGVYVLELSDPGRAAEVSRDVDSLFANSQAETLTETEKAFQLGFVSMTEAIVVAIRLVSFLVIFIILAVMANTMAMTARERMAEYATLKALGFGPAFVAQLILGESLAIAAMGGAAGILLTLPIARGFSRAVGSLFPVFHVSAGTMAMQAAAALAVGLIAALFPAWRASRVNIVEGLRTLG
ncbi:MAG: FtsX-like permease family protein [Rhodocyclaceae bacterium]|nr:FtsX-like permease family protein [Rhodocyclaceae bacterium]